MKLSIVTTMYHSEPYLREFHQRILAVAESITPDLEFVFVNDGSPDHALATAVALAAEDARVRVVDLSRNFGHHKAMMTGLGHATGDYVFLIDVDLEEPPESLSAFWRELQARGCDVVFGVQAQRHGPWFQRVTGSLYYRLFNLLSDMPVARDLLTARLMSRRYVEALLLHGEQLFNIEGLWAHTGFEQVPLEINKTGHKGSSTYTLRKKIAYVLHAVTAFSTKPLHYIAASGLFITCSAALYIVWLFIQYFATGVPVSGWTSITVSLWFLGGLIIFNLGVISTYLAVIFIETKRRPYTIVRRIYEAGPSSPSSAVALDVPQAEENPLPAPAFHL